MSTVVLHFITGVVSKKNFDRHCTPFAQLRLAALQHNGVHAPLLMVEQELDPESGTVTHPTAALLTSLEHTEL